MTKGLRRSRARADQPEHERGSPPARTLLVVSDLHLGAGRDPRTGRYQQAEKFFADGAFQRFLEYHDPRRTGPAHLVLNGDTFDFVRVTRCPAERAEFEDWSHKLSALGVERSAAELEAAVSPWERQFGLRTHDYKSLWKLMLVAQGHRAFFDALGWWVHRGGRVTFVHGNHDLELHWPLVQEGIRRAIARSHREADVQHNVRFADHGLDVDNVHIEHGHRFDAVSQVKGAPTLEGGTELRLPLATFVHRYIINTLAGLEPFLDNIKPVQRLLWAVVRRHPLKAPQLLRRGIPLLRKVTKSEWRRERWAFVLFFGSLAVPFLAAGLILLLLLVALLGPGWHSMPIETILALALLGPAVVYATNVLRDAIPGRKPLMGEDLFAERVYTAVERLEFPVSARRVYGVLGHTHRPDVQLLPSVGQSQVLYVNAGTWTPLWQEDRPDLTGQVRYTFLHFERIDEEYDLSFLEWDDERNEPVPSVILQPRSLRKPRTFLSRRERRTVEKFAEVFIEGEQEVLTAQEIASNVEQQLARIRSKRARRLRLALFVIEYLLPLPIPRPFSRMDITARRRLLQRRLARRRPWGPGRDLAKIRALVLAGYYGDQRVHASVGFEPMGTRTRHRTGRPERLGLSRLRLEDPVSEAIVCDLCVIGSGAGGAVVAAHAAAAGRDVVLLEEGRYVHASEISHDEGRMVAGLYKEDGLQTTVDFDRTILQGRCLGGSTVISNAVCFRMVDDPDLRRPGGPDTLDDWRDLGALVDRARLRDAFERVERRLCVQRITPELAGENGRVLLDGWQRLLDAGMGDRTFTANLFRKNYHQCAGCGYCNFGCPYERKYSMLETFITDAIRCGARVVPGCHAVRLDLSRANARAVRAVHVDGRHLSVRAKQIVLAGGAIGSSVLLMKSGVVGPVGRRFSFNAGVAVPARFPKTVHGFDGVQMGAFVDSGEYLLESDFLPPMAFAAALPGWFATHFERMRMYPRFAAAGVLIGTAPNGRVKRWSPLRDWFGPVAYRMTQEDLATMRRGLGMLAQTYFAAGAEAVYVPGVGDMELSARDYAQRGRINPGKIGRFLERHIRRPDDLKLTSSHPQGGNPMSDDPRIGVVDSTFRVHGYDNLFVCDASIFPTTVRVNPQLSVMALADYAWHTSIEQGS